MIYLAFNKPYGFLSQFSPRHGNPGLESFNLPRGVYACGRLDHDSEGLLILSDDGIFNNRVTSPESKKEKVYFAQVEREITEEAVSSLKSGILLKDGPARAVSAAVMDQPSLPPRIPPVRERKTVPTSWIRISLDEGRNRQVRRMLAACGFPVLRLFRYSIGSVNVEGLPPGSFRPLSKEEILSFR